MTYSVTMEKVTMAAVAVAEAKAKFSKYLEMAAAGQTVVIYKHHRPVAELRGLSVSRRRTEPRPIGRAKGRLTVPPVFFEPLPDDILSAFSGEEAPAEEAGRAPARAAERPPRYHAGPEGKRRR